MSASPGVTLASAAITGYQRYVSPYKGFRYAHRTLHGGLSCSEAIKRLIQLHGVLAAWPHVRERFAQCKHAAHTLRAQAISAALAAETQGKPPGKEKKNKKEEWYEDCIGDCAGEALGDCTPDCSCDPF